MGVESTEFPQCPPSPCVHFALLISLVATVYCLQLTNECWWITIFHNLYQDSLSCTLCGFDYCVIIYWQLENYAEWFDCPKNLPSSIHPSLSFFPSLSSNSQKLLIFLLSAQFFFFFFQNSIQLQIIQYIAFSGWLTQQFSS